MKQGQKSENNDLITTRRKTEKNAKKDEKLLFWTYRPQGPNEREKMTDRLAKEINRILAWTAWILLTGCALILTPVILAAIELFF